MKSIEPLFQTIYFGRNSTRIRKNEIEKMEEILHIMIDNPLINVNLTGWCDNTGGEAANNRISRLRAKAVRDWLVSRGIEQSRIYVIGKGIDYDESDFDKARRVTAGMEAAER